MNNDRNGSALSHYLSKVRHFLLLSDWEETLLSDTITVVAARLYLKSVLNFEPTPKQISLCISNSRRIKTPRVEKIFDFFNRVDFREDLRAEDLIGNRLSLIFMFSKLALCAPTLIEIFSEYYCFDAGGPENRSVLEIKLKHGCTHKTVLHRVMEVWRVLCPPNPKAQKDRLRALLPKDLIVTGVGGKFIERPRFVPTFNLDPITPMAAANRRSKTPKEEVNEIELSKPQEVPLIWERIFTMPQPAGITPTALPIGETIGKLVVSYIDVLVTHLNGSINLVNHNDVLQLSHKIFENGLDQPTNGLSPKTGIVSIPELARQQLVRLVDDITSEINGGTGLVLRETVIELVKQAIPEMDPPKNGRRKKVGRRNKTVTKKQENDARPTPIELSSTEAKYLDDVATKLKKECGAPKRKATVLLLAADLFPKIQDGDGTTNGLLRLTKDLEGKTKPTAFPATPQYHAVIDTIVGVLQKQGVNVSRQQAGRLLTLWLKHNVGDRVIIGHYQGQQ